MPRQDLSLAATSEWVILLVMLKGIGKHILKIISLLLWATETLTSEARRKVK